MCPKCDGEGRRRGKFGQWQQMSYFFFLGLPLRMSFIGYQAPNDKNLLIRPCFNVCVWYYVNLPTLYARFLIFLLIGHFLWEVTHFAPPLNKINRLEWLALKLFNFKFNTNLMVNTDLMVNEFCLAWLYVISKLLPGDTKMVWKHT